MGDSEHDGTDKQGPPEKNPNPEQRAIDRTVEEIDNMGKPREEPTHSPTPKDSPSPSPSPEKYGPAGRTAPTSQPGPSNRQEPAPPGNAGAGGNGSKHG